jgi:hypothetical protein
MLGMETLRCPTCVTLLPDPEAHRCPACHTKLRKRRRGPIVLGESNRLSGRSLPVDLELHVRAEARYESFQSFHAKASKSKANGEPLEAVLAFAPSEPIAEAPAPMPELVVEPEVLEPEVLEPEVLEPEVLEPQMSEPEPEPEPVPEPVAEPEPELVEDELPTLPTVPLLSPMLLETDLPPLPMPEPDPLPAHVLVPHDGEPVFLRTIDLTIEPAPVAEEIDLTTEPEPEPEPDGARYVRPTSRWQAVRPRNSASSPLDGTLNEMVEELHRKAREDVEKHGTR